MTPDAGEGDMSDRQPGAGRPRRLSWPTGTPQRAALFVTSFGFYLLLGDPTAFDVVTGAITAAVVVMVLDHVAFSAPPTRATPGRLLRAAVFLPYLLWEAVVANLAIARVVVSPSLPIDPSTTTVAVPDASDLERAVLANAISLTPGTLTVDVQGDRFVVHTLTPATRAELLSGRLPRAVRFVFGRAADETATGAATGDEG